MNIYGTVQEIRSAVRALHRDGKRVGFVPTMGALHEGHLSLVRAARKQCDEVCVSIFVNPTQFGPNEDFSKYPRTAEHDHQLLEGEGVDFTFEPGVEEMYPAGASTFVTVESLSEKLCGRSRPGHFRGVTTVVSKLFHIIEPDSAFFGQKDAAQCAVIRKMVRDLAMPVQIVVCPIVRESDGLAMSSRNRYLSGEERERSLVLKRALDSVERLCVQGERNPALLVAAGMDAFAMEPAARLDYLEIVDPDTLESVDHVAGPVLVAVAAFVGTTRLIDNLLLKQEA
ncbi:MAG: pantoate--beta-alanine ligase [Acidobacteriales bacterium]|nr:pantoate--beta-alanine ligase [Terriglobales bacterium]